MKPTAALTTVVLLLAGALVLSQARKAEAPVGPYAIVNLIADSQRELTRLPVKFAPLDDAEEIKVGYKLDEMYDSLWRRDDRDETQRAIETYVQQVGAQVAAHAHRKLPYRFHYIPDLDFINAFALPGGPVIIGGGLMALMDSEDELANVLGHEIEHIDHYHCAERIQIEMAIRRLPLGELAAIPTEVFMMGYTKNQEFEADREGAKLAAAASYSPQSAINMFEAFQRLYPPKEQRSGSPAEELSRVARQTLEDYFRSHPLPSERADQVRKMIAAGVLPSWTHTKDLPVAYYFLRERAWRSFQAALVPTYPSLPDKEKRKRDAERVKQYQEAARLASQSVSLKPNQPRTLEILALSQFALDDYAGAAATYRKLLPDWPSFAGSVGVYADELAKQALDAGQFAKAAQITRQVLELQPNLPGALKILAEAQLSAQDFAGAAETCAKLKNLYPDEARDVRTFADERAESAWGKRRYQEAASLSGISLDLAPGQERALSLLAKSQFALANFSAAADAYRKLFETKSHWDSDVVRAYATALSARDDKSQGPPDLQALLAKAAAPEPSSVRVARAEMAGLWLMAGSEAQAQSILDDAQMPPEILGRLGWWYYRAGKYDAARVVLARAISARPADPELQTAMAWTELEQHHPENALRFFNNAPAAKSAYWPEMGRVIALWQTHQIDEALKFRVAVVCQAPEWQNPHWVSALFSPSVAQTVAQIEAEVRRHH